MRLHWTVSGQVASSTASPVDLGFRNRVENFSAHLFRYNKADRALRSSFWNKVILLAGGAIDASEVP